MSKAYENFEEIMNGVFEEPEDNLPSLNRYEEPYLGPHIEAGTESAENFGFVKANILLDENIRPPENTVVYEGQSGYLVFEDQFLDGADIRYAEKIHPVLPEELRSRNKHMTNKDLDGGLKRAERIEYEGLMIDSRVNNSFDAVSDVILASMKDFIYNELERIS